MRNTEKYEDLIDELKVMISSKDRGYDTAQQINDQFWEELSTHKERMMEQIGKVKSAPDESLNEELATADSIYEATRNNLMKK